MDGRAKHNPLQNREFGYHFTEWVVASLKKIIGSDKSWVVLRDIAGSARRMSRQCPLGVEMRIDDNK